MTDADFSLKCIVDDGDSGRCRPNCAVDIVRKSDLLGVEGICGAVSDSVYVCIHACVYPRVDFRF